MDRRQEAKSSKGEPSTGGKKVKRLPSQITFQSIIKIQKKRHTDANI